MDAESANAISVSWEGAVRRAYEFGRARVAARHAFTLSAMLAAFAFIAVSHIVLPWLAVPIVLWALIEWRGGALLRGGRFGILAGIATLVAPMTLLRPCCRPGMAMGPDCCALPGTCALVGVCIGLSLTVFLPRISGARRFETACGTALGVLAVSVLKCPMLVASEIVGLISGQLGGVALAALASACWVRWLEPQR